MGKTIRNYKGEQYPDKSKKRAKKDRKSFGWTSGTHSGFENAKTYWKERFEETSEDDVMYPVVKKNWEHYKDKTYPEKGVDYVKHGYGRKS